MKLITLISFQKRMAAHMQHMNEPHLAEHAGLLELYLPLHITAYFTAFQLPASLSRFHSEACPHETLSLGLGLGLYSEISKMGFTFSKNGRPRFLSLFFLTEQK